MASNVISVENLIVRVRTLEEIQKAKRRARMEAIREADPVFANLLVELNKRFGRPEAVRLDVNGETIFNKGKLTLNQGVKVGPIDRITAGEPVYREKKKTETKK